MSEYILPKRKVRDIMVKEVVTVKSEDTIKKLIDVIRKYGYHSYPVMKEEKVVGVVTKTDVIKILTGNSLEHIFATQVRDIMRISPQVISPEMDLEEVTEILTKEKFRALPVIENEKLVGLVSKTTIVHQIIKKEKSEDD